MRQQTSPQAQPEASSDHHLVSIVDAAMAEAVRRSGDWVVCKTGCTECCRGPFPVTPLDAARLRTGLAALAASHPARAAAVTQRAALYRELTAGVQDAGALPPSLDDEPCPLLDPATGCCDLYAARPITCRTFGPATFIGEGAVAACELCYQGAGEEELARCAVEVDPGGLEQQLLQAAGATRETLVAWALAPETEDRGGVVQIRPGGCAV